MRRAACVLAAAAVLCLVTGGALVRLVAGVTGSLACGVCVLALASSAGWKMSRRPRAAARPVLVRGRVTSPARDVRPAHGDETRTSGTCACGGEAAARLDGRPVCALCAADWTALHADADIAEVSPDGDVRVTEVRAFPGADTRPGSADMTEFEDRI